MPLPISLLPLLCHSPFPSTTTLTTNYSSHTIDGHGHAISIKITVSSLKSHCNKLQSSSRRLSPLLSSVSSTRSRSSRTHFRWTHHPTIPLPTPARALHHPKIKDTPALTGCTAQNPTRPGPLCSANYSRTHALAPPSHLHPIHIHPSILSSIPISSSSSIHHFQHHHRRRRRCLRLRFLLLSSPSSTAIHHSHTRSLSPLGHHSLLCNPFSFDKGTRSLRPPRKPKIFIPSLTAANSNTTTTSSCSRTRLRVCHRTKENTQSLSVAYLHSLAVKRLQT